MKELTNPIHPREITFTQAAILAERSYDGEYGLEDYSSFANGPIKYIKDHTQLYIYKLKNGKTVLSFQGSNGYLDWLDDLNCFIINKRIQHESMSSVKISKGFDDNYEHIAQTVFDVIDTVGLNNVILIGHSLGAANALRARFEIKLKYNVTIPVIAFGEPHGGNKAYYDFIGTDKYWSIQDGNDVVCHVPFCSWGYYSPSRIKVDGTNIKVPHVSISFLLKKFGSCDDHYPQRYVEGCRKFES